MAGVRLTCSPPQLGITELRLSDKGDPTFHVRAYSENPLDNLIVELWAKTELHDEWQSTPFRHVPAKSTVSYASFVLDIPRKNPGILEFTIRYRHKTGAHEWSWISTAGENGQLVFLPFLDNLSNISPSDIFHHYDSAIRFEDVNSSVPDTQLLSISVEAPVKSPELTSISLGKPKGLVQWLSLERLMSFWMEPNQGRKLLNTPRDSFLIAFMREDGTHVVLLPISGMKDECQVWLKTDEKSGSLMMHTKNDNDKAGLGRVILGRGTTLSPTVDAVFAYTRSLFQNDYAMTKQECEPVKVDPQWFEDWIDGLFYCTWNAMYTDVTEEKILHAVAGLDKQGIQVTGVIIDDGWQDIDDKRRWQSFEPTKSRFPNGLRGTVTTLKKRFPYIKHVGVWHALLGYWNGMSPSSWISQNYTMLPITMRKITVPRGLEAMHVVDPREIARMYDEFYKYLAAEGITVVKCDVQASPDDISHSFPKERQLWRDYQDAFKAASLRHLSRRVIYCMSHVADIYLHSLLQRNVPPACIRNSNDFFPDQPDSHAWHIFWNANNDLYTSRLNVLPDWDMFDTAHPQAALHALSRSLSGGPILITDQVGKSDANLIVKMTSKSIRNAETRILRFPSPAVCRYPYLNFTDGRFTKITNRTYDILTLGVFNTTKQPATEAISLFDFTAHSKVGVTYAVFEQISGTVRLTTHDPHELLFSAELEENRSLVYTASPLLTLPSNNETIAVLGLVDKYAGSVAISNSRVSPSTHPALSIKLTHLGVLGIWLSFEPELSRILVTIADIVVPDWSVEFAMQNDGEGGVLKVDTERAWREMNVDDGWSNEVTVVIYFRD